MRAFERQLGSQTGVQLNPIKDRTDNFAAGTFDQVIAMPMRARRGRIDRPFPVTLANFTRKLGKSQSITVSPLNEAMVQGWEALKRGARQLIVSRLHVAAASVKWAVFTSAAPSTFAVANAAPANGHTIAIKHLECHNDGIKFRFHADKVMEGAVAVANKVVTVVVLDSADVELYRFTGSLDPAAKDEADNSFYLPEVAERRLGDVLEFDIPEGAVIGPTHDAYGKDAGGKDKWASSGLLACFVEGDTAYTSEDYARAVKGLREAREDYGYIISGGSASVALITGLADLAYDTNRVMGFDVPGDLTPAAAAAFVASLGFGTLGRDHYPIAFWAPLKARDPLNGNQVIFGTAGYHFGMRCARNARTNAHGLAPKNYPVAGRDWPLERPGIVQVYTPETEELSALADGRVNPVIYQAYNGGGRYVFTDVLTCAASKTSYRTLSTVAEMSAWLDELIVRFAREALLLPMQESIRRVEIFMEDLFTDAKASGWILDGTDDNDGTPIPAYAYSVKRNDADKARRFDIEHWLHYDGVARQVHVQQSIV